MSNSSLSPPSTTKPAVKVKPRGKPQLKPSAGTLLLLRDGPKKFVKFAPPTPNLLGYHLSDFGNAQRLIALYGPDLRYCHSFKKWFCWDGKRWATDDTGQARRLASLTMVEFLRQALSSGSEEKKDFASSSLNSGAIGAMLKMAESEHFIRPADLDTDLNLLNFVNGTLDLKTGVLRPHRREDFITKLIHHNYNPVARCPLWLAFLSTIMRGNRQMVAYLQRALGYSLTGSTIEKAVFVLFGDGNNGKTTLLALVRKLIEEYATLLQIDTLLVRQESNNTHADLADLRGARFVMTSESEIGQGLAQAKLKRITQGMGTIKATRKYENPIEFPESHKLWVDTNHKPEITDADDQATFNRLHPIPFLFTVPKAEIDRDLPAKLLGEAEGILAWAVQGAKLWHKHGLGKPPAVQAAVNEWRAESDRLEHFIDARCESGGYAKAEELFKAYRKWAETAGENVILSRNDFGAKMGQRDGITKHRKNGGNVYEGIELRKHGSKAVLDRS